MFIPIFILGLVLWLGLARLALRWVKLEHRRKVWRWFLVVTLLICTADHIAGIIYAHVWVAMAQGKPSMTLKTDELVAFQEVVGDKRYWVTQHPIALKLEKYFALPGYGKFQVIMPTGQDSDELSGNAYEIELTRNANDPDCKLFYALPKTEKEMTDWELKVSLGRGYDQESLLKKAAQHAQGGEQGRCIAARPIPKITARYLQKYMEIAPNPPIYPTGLYEFVSIKITDMKISKVLCENRRVFFYGGWVFRYFLIDPTTNGRSPQYRVESPGFCSVEPAHGSTYQTDFDFHLH